MADYKEKILEWANNWRLKGNTRDFRIPELHLRHFINSLPSEKNIAKKQAQEWLDSIDEPHPWTHGVQDVMDIYFKWLDKEE